MTSQQQADEALSVWRANRNNPEVEAMLDRHFREVWDTCRDCQGEGSTDEHRPQYDDPDFCVVIKCEACGGSGWEQTA